MATPLPPPHKEYMIGGVKVLFPVKPYPSQMAMMAQIVRGLRRRQNCLLESPTGSGKSLALLCSTLAWHQAEKEKAERYNDLIFQGVTDPDILARVAGVTNAPSTADSRMGIPSTPRAPIATPDPVNPVKTSTQSSSTTASVSAAAAAASASGGGFIPEGDDLDFRSESRVFRNHIEVEASLGGLNESFSNEDPSFMGEDPFNPQVQQPRLMRVPKIYFGTRTHKQIYQIMKELRRTAYKHVKTVVLSSREYTCIHPVVSKMRNKNEGCQQLIDPREGSCCNYNHNVIKMKTHEKLAHYGIQPAWDIEDLVTLGKKIGACPYYAARSLKETADVVFCPYNYLVDPIVRDTLSIELRDQIIILDEAHNIEDSARESASCTIKQQEMLEAIQDLDKMATLKFCIDECTKLSQMLSSLSGWVDLNKENLTDYNEFDRSGKIFSGTEMVATLDHLQIGRNRHEELKKCLATVTADQDPEEYNPKLKSATTMLLKSLFLMYHFLLLDNMKYRDDYRIALVKSQIRNSGKRNSGGYYSKKMSIGWEFSINFWCFNPGVAFSSVGADARSIILTSGTLSPMSSFQSELAVPFQIQLEANHVIEKNQVWVGTISRGPTEQTLQATYRNVETWEFQDELGRLVLDVCKVIPHGVLCFLPSYSMLNKLLDRWQCTGMWEELSQIKVAVTEPRKSDEFDETMSLFYDTIKDTQETKMGCGINGAFFMAVCRGKVSEGLDFTDDNARAVISVGIPFPNIKDIQVDLKRQYNNQHCKTRGLLPGSDWYEIQAYRALNQALGRCIRHRYDWGALILVDDRFQRGNLAGGMQPTKYTRGLSKWVRNKIVHHHSFSMALSDLRQFAENMIANPPVKPESLDESLVVNNHESSKQKEMSSLDLGKLCVESERTAASSEDTSNQPVSPFKDVPTQMESNISEIAGFNTSVVGGVNSNLGDSDFFTSDEDLVIPPSRIPFTSTQVSRSKDEDLVIPRRIPYTSTQVSSSKDDDLVIPPLRIPFTSTQVSGSKAKDLVISPHKIPFTSTQDSRLKDGDLAIPPNTTLFSSTQSPNLKVVGNQSSAVIANCEPETKSSIKFEHVSNSCSTEVKPLKRTPLPGNTTSQPAIKRKSFSLVVEDPTKDTTKDMTPTKGVNPSNVNDNYEFKYVNVSKTSNVSPLKALLEKEIGIAPIGEKSKKRLIDAMDSDCEQSEDSEIKHQNRLSNRGNSSPQMFDSDDDLFAEESPVNISLRSSENKCYGSIGIPLSSTPNRRDVHTKGIVESSSSTKTSDHSHILTSPRVMHEKAEFGKENSKHCKKLEENHLPSQTLVHSPHSEMATGNDSDLDDFCLNKSYSTSRVKKIRRLSKGKSTRGKS